ncbi:MAG: phage holin family protein [Pyrinomonadaceae bacterium]|nr:phage holin family protein [Pyrinomonadaceae bacterium]
MAAPSTAVATARDSSLKPESESLPSLVGRLGDDVVQLFDTKLSLLKVELKEEANAYARGGIAIALGGIVAAVGFALLNVAVAFAVSTIFANANLSQSAKYALGFGLTGLFYLTIGGIVILTVKNRLAHQALVPNKTVEELRRDKQWLKNEL